MSHLPAKAHTGREAVPPRAEETQRLERFHTAAVTELTRRPV